MPPKGVVEAMGGSRAAAEDQCTAGRVWKEGGGGSGCGRGWGVLQMSLQPRRGLYGACKEAGTWDVDGFGMGLLLWIRSYSIGSAYDFKLNLASNILNIFCITDEKVFICAVYLNYLHNNCESYKNK